MADALADDVLLLDRRGGAAREGLRLYGGAAAELLRARRAGDGPRVIVTPNLDHWRLLSRSRAFRRAYAAADVVLNDSRFLARAAFGPAATTLPGSELVVMMLAEAPAGSRVLVIGCPPAVRDHLAATRPDLVLDTVEPSQGFVFRRAERRALAEHAANTAPDRIFVCTGAPQSELFAAQLARRLTHACDILCCGAGLQFAAGLKPRAPRWMQRLGAEWLWRALAEPHTRLRYLRDAAYFATRGPAFARLRCERETTLDGTRVSRG